MKRNGFTLVELLAVIVILAVISIITIPMIGSVIEDSRKKALENSVHGLVEAATYFTISNDGIYEFIFDENKKGESIKGESLDYNGSIEAEGKLYIDNDGNISLCLMNEDYYVYKNYNSGIYIGNVTDDTCIVGYDAITNKYVAMLDDGTGSISNVYSKEEVNELVDGLEEKIDSNSISINTLTSIVTNNQNNIELIQAELDKYALQEDLDKKNTNVSTNTTEINQIKIQLDNLTIISNIEALNTVISENKSNIATNITNITNLQEKIGNIENDLNNMSEWEQLSFDDVFTTTKATNGTIKEYAINKKGNHIYAVIGFSGSITSGSNATVAVLNINEEYRPLRDFSQGVMVNKSSNTGQVHTAATAFSTFNKSQIAIVFPDMNTTYGNDLYPWCTSSWLRLDWEI